MAWALAELQPSRLRMHAGKRSPVEALAVVLERRCMLADLLLQEPHNEEIGLAAHDVLEVVLDHQAIAVLPVLLAMVLGLGSSCPESVLHVMLKASQRPEPSVLLLQVESQTGFQ